MTLPLDFDRLRAIGYHWDPIGASGGPAQYDPYLLEAVSRLRNGQSESDVAEFLFEVESKQLGLGDRGDARHRARFAAAAIRNYLESL